MLETGSIIGEKYKILREIGRGGMGVVYLAVDEQTKKQWAVKVLDKHGLDQMQTWEKEICIMKRLKHPCLPVLAEVIDMQECCALVMDYIEGESLGDLLQKQGPQSQEKVVRWAVQLCDVLGYLHGENVIYRDLKPDNIILRPNGTLVLIDFGSALDDGLGTPSSNIGTVGYAAPEQYVGDSDGSRIMDPRTDIYALGITMYQLLTGCDPTEGSGMRKPISSIQSASMQQLVQIIEKCTQRDPQNRYRDVAQLLSQLKMCMVSAEQYRRRQVCNSTLFLLAVILAAIAVLIAILRAKGAIIAAVVVASVGISAILFKVLRISDAVRFFRGDHEKKDLAAQSQRAKPGRRTVTVRLPAQESDGCEEDEDSECEEDTVRAVQLVNRDTPFCVLHEITFLHSDVIIES